MAGIEPGPPDQKSSALPTELLWQSYWCERFSWYTYYKVQNKAKKGQNTKNWCKYLDSSRYSVKIIFWSGHKKIQNMDHLNPIYSA